MFTISVIYDHLMYCYWEDSKFLIAISISIKVMDRLFYSIIVRQLEICILPHLLAHYSSIMDAIIGDSLSLSLELEDIQFRTFNAAIL